MYQLMALLMSLQAQLQERERGQGLVEYALIIALVSLAVIVGLVTLYPKINEFFSRAGSSMS